MKRARAAKESCRARSQTCLAISTATASAEEPGLLDRLVKSILGGGSVDDSGTAHPSNTPAQQPVPIWKNRDAQDARKSK